MPVKRLTEASVRALPCKRVTYRVHDSGPDHAPGMHINVQPTGRRTYMATWHLPKGKRKSMALGDVGVITLDEAREECRRVRRVARRGIDPKRGSTDQRTFGQLLDEWHAHQRDAKERVSANETHAVVLYSCNAWLERPVATITRTEIEDLLRAKRDSGTKSAANRLHSHLRTFFKWAHRQRGLSTNPAVDVEAPWQVSKKRTRRKRDWFKGEAADNVIRLLWRWADVIASKQPDQARFIKLLIVTGKRRNAVLDMSWEHISKSWDWEPPYRSEYKRNDPVPLPKLAQRILGPRRDDGRIIKPFLPSWLQQQARRRKGMPPDFIWHGVRHVVITKLRELGVARHIAKLITDHKEDDVHADYEHDLPRKEMLAALELWCAHLEHLVAPAEGVAVLR